MDPYLQQPPVPEEPQQPQQPQNGGIGFSVSSMVLGIVSLVFSCCLWYIALPLSLVGLILGIIALKKNSGGRGMAIAGVVTSAIGLVLAIITVLCVFVFMSSGDYSSMLDYLKNYSNTASYSNSI